MHDMCVAAINGDEAKAREINQELVALHQFLFVETNPIPVKWALTEMAMIPKGIRLPMTVLSEKYHQSVREALITAGVLNSNSSE
jgi:4-hydroxy-tetrahydrodipicolinate synthase